MTKKTISSLSVDSQTIENMKQAIKKFNDKSIFEITEATYRRHAIELLNYMILNEKDIPKLNREVNK